MKNLRSFLLPATAIALVAVLSCLFYALSLLNEERSGRLQERSIAANWIVSERNAKNEETAKIRTLEIQAKELAAYKAAADPELRRLGQLADRYRGKLQAAAVFRSETRLPRLESEATVSPPDTASPGLLISATVQDSAGWFRAMASARIDSAGRASIALDSIRILEAFELIFRRETYGFLGLRAENVTELKSLNPYATTSQLQSWRAPAKTAGKPFVFGALSTLAAVGLFKIIGVL